IVPRADEHQGEYVPPRAERLAWLTGFTGSAGLAVVLRQAAAIFVDGRYTLQVTQQVDGALFVARHVTDQPPEAWIAETLPAGGKLGYDPWLHTPDGLQSLRRGADAARPRAAALCRAPALPHPAGRRDGTGARPRAALRRPRVGREADDPGGKAGGGQGGRGGAGGAGLAGLAAQHPRRRRAAHAAAPGLRGPARRRRR